MTRKTLRVGIAGCGGITPWTLQQLSLHLDLVSVVALQDPREEAREAVGRRFGIPVRHTTFSALCAGGLDLVVINAPNDLHRPLVEEAAARGIACLVQKPLASTLADGEAILAAAEAAGVPLGVVMAERSDPLHHELRALLRRGFFGEPVLLESLLAHDGYLRTPPPEGDWRRDRERVGGGVFAQLAVHGINLLAWLTGRPCTEVTALHGAGNTVFEDETTAAVARIGPSTLATITASWACRGERWAIHGTAGAIVVDPEHVTLRGRFVHDGPLLRYHVPGREVVLSRAALDAAAAPLLARHEVHGGFARFVAGEGDNPSPAADSLHDLAVLDAVHRACATGRAMPVRAPV